MQPPTILNAATSLLFVLPISKLTFGSKTNPEIETELLALAFQTKDPGVENLATVVEFGVPDGLHEFPTEFPPV